MSYEFKVREQKTVFKSWLEIAMHDNTLIIEISRDTNMIVRFYDTKKQLKYCFDFDNQTIKEYYSAHVHYNKILAEFVKLYYPNEDVRVIKDNLDSGYTYALKEEDWTDTVQGNLIKRVYTDGTVYERIYIEK